MLSWLACTLLGVCGGGPLKITFFSNGASVGGVERILDDKSMTAQDALLTLSDTPLALEAQSASLYSSVGEEVLSMSTVGEAEKLYVVPDGDFFFWPFVRVGHKVEVSNLEGRDNVYIESISEEPRLFYLHNFLDVHEADTLRDRVLKATGKNAIAQSTVGPKLRENRDLTDERSFSSVRTSDNAWDTNSADALPVIKRSFGVARVPFVDMLQDGLQLLRYQVRQAYVAHHDYFGATTAGPEGFNFDTLKGGSNRMVTIFLYLSDVEEGGQTVFPHRAPLSDEELLMVSPELRELLLSHKLDPANVTAMANELFPEEAAKWQPKMIQTCYDSLSVRPRKNAALMFYSQTPKKVLDPTSIHGGCPVIKGTKWGANMWLWNSMRFGHTPTNEMEIDVVFTNNGAKPGKLLWQGKEQGIIRPGDSLLVHSHHGTRFKFRVGSKSLGYRVEAKRGNPQTHSFGHGYKQEL